MQLELFASTPIARATDSETSHVAAVEVEPKLTCMRAEFVRRLKAIGYPATAQEIAQGCETIRKRALECVRLGLVVEAGTRRCNVTGKNAKVYWSSQ